jgi:hypothetical protein
MRLTAFSVVPAVLVSAACVSEPSSDEPATAPVDETVVPLSSTESLLRVSMAIRGKRPSAADLQSVEQHPERLEQLATGYLESDDFGATIRDLYNEALKVRVAASLFPAGFAARDELAGEDVQRIGVSVTEAPLRLIEHVIREDRPLTEIVTASYTLADSYVARVWGLEYDGSGESWEVTHYADGRAEAGILSDSWLYTRHSSTFSNKNRGRANAISRALLCHDYTQRSVEVDVTIDLADPAQVSNAIANNPTCVSCHQTLDPLAAHFASFYPLFVPSFLDAYPFEGYAPELGPLFSVKDPGYFGYPSGDVAYLGRLISEDPRFATCQARRFYSYFHQVPLDAVPQAELARLVPVLTKGYDAKALVRAIVLAPAFLASHRTRDDAAAEAPTVLRARPFQLAHTIADLTGFRWQSTLPYDLGYGEIGRVDLMTDSLFGFEVIDGGIDSVNVTLPSHVQTASATIVTRALSLRAADAVVEADAEFPASAKLFLGFTPETSDEAGVRAGLAAWHLRLFGQTVSADSEPVNDAYALFSSARAESGDVRRAWKLTLAAMLQHPRLTFY